ncbi:hypothetical protein [Paludisphaera borealis]|uniref:Uncharacterized protein n=1 Tax=Paludisphaera borealis TaxID=1387353 RepID=A0A1U7CUP9_9BACT|nr:hypothetical protein [Paludisphaera borealis]APW62674.1 hypothetical protein BSF38_04224 [Paludisphaera borealis]
MGDSPTGLGSDPDNDPVLADAKWLFRDAPPPETTPPRRPVVASGSEESFDLADTPPPAPAPASVPTPRERAAEPADEAPAPRRPKPSRQTESASAVDQVWSRGAEWGPTLAVLGLWAAFVVFLLFLTLSGEFYTLTLLVLAMGLVVGLVLCYPIVITLERPVRMTPEQAARDFYGALSHHRPHYRRMWLLLSNAGRTSSRFASFEGFQKYWVERIKQLRQGKAGSSAPLTFLVAEFKSEKSGGKTAIDAEWKVKVFVRGQRDQGPIWSLPVESHFSKGPDGMWYLDNGTLAERSPSL